MKSQLKIMHGMSKIKFTGRIQIMKNVTILIKINFNDTNVSASVQRNSPLHVRPSMTSCVHGAYGNCPEQSAPDTGLRTLPQSTEEAQGLISYISSVSDKPKC